MADVPRERSLVKNLAGKPFVLLGVNSDSDRDALRKVLGREKIVWRSWWDSGSTHGPIATRWNVQSWPTLYLIDGKGVIRYKGQQLLDEAVDTLIKETDRR